ncbi:MAG TPA: DNA replication/repair protein RecF [Gammaproteobacteria bacterium]|nr:DNA replication/repair protein RecF [Gammaproteobacteria bacterium]
MQLIELDIQGVRNLSEAHLTPSPGLNVIAGPNASGKTSLLEAIGLLSTARSFRTPRIARVIQHAQDWLQVVGQVAGPGARVQRIGLRRDARQSVIRIDGETVKQGSRLARCFPVQVITPASHELLEQGPKFRRRFLDWGLFHVEHAYHGAWQDYMRLLRQRNAVLRLGDARQLPHWDRLLAEKGEQLDRLRVAHLAGFESLFAAHGARLLDQKVSIRYRRGWDAELDLHQALGKGRESDLHRGFTQIGPHRMDLVFRSEAGTARETFSRGQQKLLVAAARLAQVQLVDQSAGIKTVLLVDDVAAELDRTRRQRLMDLLRGLQTQVFVTATEAELLPVSGWETVKMFHVEHGVVREVV